MDTQKKDSYNKIILAVVMVLAAGLNAHAQDKEPAQVLIDSYKLPDTMTKEAAQRAVSELNDALALCTDGNIKLRLEYRIGMIYFKAGDLTKACGCFEKIAHAAECPDLIKLCSFNMAGQVYRMQAKDEKSLGAFEKVIELSQKFLAADPNQIAPASVLKLAATAGFAKAEIYQYNQRYDSAIDEYKRIISNFKSNKITDSNTYVSLALDRISQLCLIKGRIEDYNQASVELIEKHSDYYRTGIIKFEIEAIKILKEKDTSVAFPRGSFDAPARLIGLIKDNGDKELKDKIASLLKNLSSQYPKSYSGILLAYHYAWLLDASGKQKESVKVLESICKEAEMVNHDVPGIAQVISTLSDYAKLQQAVIMGEENKYREALEIACSIKADPNDIHMLNLKDSVEKAFDILKREVPKDANEK